MRRRDGSKLQWQRKDWIYIYIYIYNSCLLSILISSIEHVLEYVCPTVGLPKSPPAPCPTYATPPRATIGRCHKVFYYRKSCKAQFLLRWDLQIFKMRINYLIRFVYPSQNSIRFISLVVACLFVCLLEAFALRFIVQALIVWCIFSSLFSNIGSGRSSLNELVVFYYSTHCSNWRWY